MIRPPKARVKRMLSLPDSPIRQRDFLLEITRAITAQLDITEVLRRVLRASVVMVAGQVGLIALRDDDDQFRMRAYTGFQEDKVNDLNTLLQQLIVGAESGDSQY